ncbi:hypothetical protein LZZ85_13695 [Terrimonas sp. NA20]|uniref:Uncharacterized protein n=1 Tax=Terrimonas ginsenosidimutans TaxID=2908004 RepID=A0ABS9KSP9_9BACT|nr:hypothetical protein [Terrimonas ginsenosidimutans]MCG2615348.1 hypothetical protein [Terrimonas ginsenosidimutans]
MSYYQLSLEYAGSSIVLKKSSRFTFESWDCVSRRRSGGTWSRVKDTLFLHSDLQVNDVQIRLSFKKGPSHDSLRIAMLKDVSGRELVYSKVMFNYDSAFSYIMGVDDRAFAPREIRSIKFDLGNDTRTRWYSLPEGFTGVVLSYLDITVEELDNYCFMDRQRFIMKGKKIYPIAENVSAGNTGRMIRSKHFYSKVKR